MRSRHFACGGTRKGNTTTRSIHTTPDSDQLLSTAMDDKNHALPTKDFVTVDELCELFGLARITINGWLQTGELPHYRLGPRTIRISRADLDAFLAERRLTGMPGRLGDDGRLIQSADDLPADAGNSHATPRSGNIRSSCSSPDEAPEDRTAAA